MKKSHKKLLLGLILILLINVPIIAFANSMEPPSVIILVINAPEDLSITAIDDEGETKAIVRKHAWESSYLFYRLDRNSSDTYTYKIVSGETQFELTFSKPLKRYNEVLTLDLDSQTMSYGKYPHRAILLVSIRLVLTLLIEGCIFWLFGFRSKRSWITFLVINLLTQGALNIWINYDAGISAGYLIFALIFWEFFIFIIEMILLPLFINEQKKSRIFTYAFLANCASLFLGGYLITLLPV